MPIFKAWKLPNSEIIQISSKITKGVLLKTASKTILAHECAPENHFNRFFGKFWFRKVYLEVQTIPDKKYNSNFVFSNWHFELSGNTAVASSLRKQ